MTLLATKKFVFRMSFAAIFLITVHFFLRSYQPLAPSPSSHDRPIFDYSSGAQKTTHASPQAISLPTSVRINEELLLDDSKQHAGHTEDKAHPAVDEAATTTTTSSTTTTEIPRATETADAKLRDKIRRYKTAILDPSSTAADRMICPSPNRTRYSHLRASSSSSSSSPAARKYFFALDLRQVVDLLPRLLGSIVEAMHFLGPESCALSIVEGNSDDGTWEVLAALEDALGDMGVEYYLKSEELDPIESGDRIGGLVDLRQMALAPLRNGRERGVKWVDDAVVMFMNDVAACTEDILELLHQRVIQDADMTCAMDWYHPGGKDAPPLFYDVWISRTHSGNLFFDIPDTGSWENSEHLFPYDADAHARKLFANHQPFQVFACWNGAVAFTAAPILNGTVGFRRVKEEECFQGEPQLFCKDMWWAGYGRIAVIPTVNLEYTDERGRWIKEKKGFVSDLVGDGKKKIEAKEYGDTDNEEGKRKEVNTDLRIQWKGPPDMVKCMPTFDRQSWLPWNESLVK